MKLDGDTELKESLFGPKDKVGVAIIAPDKMEIYLEIRRKVWENSVEKFDAELRSLGIDPDFYYGSEEDWKKAGW